MAIATKFPTIRPSLDLNFASGNFDPRITFTRNSSATYFGSDGLLKTASANEPRIDYDPVTGESLGLLIEEQRTNLLTRSQEFDNSSWIKIRSSVTVNAATAPDGTLTADKLIATNTSGDHFLLQRKTENRNITYSATVFAKAAEFSKLRVHILPKNASANRVAAKFDLYAGTVYETRNEGDGGGVTASIMGVGGGWYRCSVSGIPSTSNAGTATEILVSIINNSGQEFGWAGDGTSGIYIWGAQLEVGAFPTSYIPTPAVFTSRNSTATYFDSAGVMKTAAINEPRYDHGFVNRQWVSKGLVLENSATNLLTYSEKFDNAAWVKLNATVSANAATAPDGTLTADKLVENTASSTHLLYQNPALADNTVYCHSVFAKASERSHVAVLITDKSNIPYGRIFNLTDGTSASPVGVLNAPLAHGMQSVGNGWYLCWVAQSAGSGATQNSPRIYTSNGSAISYTGDGTSGIYVWGAQLEDGTQPTSYIKTEATSVTRAADLSTSNAVTRAADSSVMTGTNFSSWYNQAAGSFYADYTLGSQAISWSVLSANDAAAPTQNNVSMRYASGGQAQYQVSAGGVFSANLAPSGFNASGASYKRSIAYATNSFNQAINGALPSDEDTSGATPVVNVLRIGSENVGVNYLCGHIRRIAYYPKRLSNTQLQALTA